MTAPTGMTPFGTHPGDQLSRRSWSEPVEGTGQRLTGGIRSAHPSVSTDPHLAQETLALAAPNEVAALNLALDATRLLIVWHAGAVDAEEAMSTLYRSFRDLLTTRESPPT